MIRIAPDFWTALAASRSTADQWRVRPPFAEVTTRLLGSISGTGARRYLVTLLPNEAPAEDSRSRGLSVHTEEFADEHGHRARYVVIECRDPVGHEVFDFIGADLADAISTQPPAEGIRRVLAKWRRFWGQVPRSLLSRDEQVGLFAEIWFFSRWLAPAAGALPASRRWRGPFRARHDFEWLGTSVEVKATTAVRGALFHINGIEQLEPPDGGRLYLFTLNIREEAGAMHTLPSVIGDARTITEPDGDALGLFETALLQSGYSPAHDPDYAQVHWRIVDQRLYAVSDSFPRLRPAHFAGGLPLGVTNISYLLDVAAAGSQFIREPQTAAAALR